MRQKRAKAYKKQMNVYLHTFKFREPFQTIVDDEIILNCEKASFDIAKGLNRTIQGETKPMITQCSIEALYKTNNQDAISIVEAVWKEDVVTIHLPILSHHQNVLDL